MKKKIRGTYEDSEEDTKILGKIRRSRGRDNKGTTGKKQKPSEEGRQDLLHRGLMLSLVGAPGSVEPLIKCITVVPSL